MGQVPDWSDAKVIRKHRGALTEVICKECGGVVLYTTIIVLILSD